MFPSSLFPPAIYPPAVFPGAGKGSTSTGSAGLVGLFPPSLFPIALFPPGIFPGPNKGSTSTGSAGLVGLFPQSLFPPALFPPALFPGPGSTTTTAAVVIFTDQLAQYLGTNPGVSAYPNKLPSRYDEYPLLSFTVVAGDNVMLIGGASSMATITIQLDCYSPNSFEAEVLSEQLRQTLQDFQGMLGLIPVRNCIASHPRSGYEPSPVGDDAGYFRASRDFKFWYRR